MERSGRKEQGDDVFGSADRAADRSSVGRRGCRMLEVDDGGRRRNHQKLT